MENSYKSFSRSLLRASALLLLLSGIGKCAGFARESLMALYLGATAKTDVYLFVYMFFDYATFAGSAVLLASIPDFDHAAQGAKSLYRRYRWVLLALFLLVVGFSTITAIGLAQTLPLSERSDFVFYAFLMNWSFPLMALVNLQAGLLQSWKKFLLPGILSTVMNVVSILVLVGWHSRLGALSIIVGLIAGLVLQVFLQGEGIRRHDTKNLVAVAPAKTGTPGFLRRIWAIASSQLILKAMLLVDRLYAVHIGVGVLSYLGYASRLVLFPLTLVGTAVASALFPFQVQALREDLGRYRHLTGRALRGVFIAALAVVAILMALGPVMVSIVYRHGQFSDHDAVMTTAALYSYSCMLIPGFLNIVLANCLYCSVRPRVYVSLSGALLGTYALLAWALIPIVGFTAMGWAATLTGCVQAVVSYACLRRTGVLLHEPGLPSFLVRVGLTGVASWASMWAFGLIIARGSQPPDSLLARIVFALFVPLVIGLAVFYIFGRYVVRLSEIRALTQGLIKQFDGQSPEAAAVAALQTEASEV